MLILAETGPTAMKWRIQLMNFIQQRPIDTFIHILAPTMIKTMTVLLVCISLEFDCERKVRVIGNPVVM